VWTGAVVVKAVPQHLQEELQETAMCCGTADGESNTGLSKYEARVAFIYTVLHCVKFTFY
jgi:hypothetical protein